MDGAAAFSGSGEGLNDAKGDGEAGGAASCAAGAVANGDSGTAVKSDGVAGGIGAPKGEETAGITPKGEGGGLA